MEFRAPIIFLLSSSLLAGSVGAARADGAEAFVGGLLGSAIGTAITNQAQQRQRVVVEKRYVKPAAKQRQPQAQVNSYQREENRRVQTALNYFGFNAGPADGVLGANSRASVRTYQATLGWPGSGVLMEHEKMFLLSSYERAMIGGPQVAEVMVASGQGPLGLLLAWRREQLGIQPGPMAPQAPMVVPATVPEAVPQQAPVQVVPTTAPVAPEPAQPVVAVPAAAPAAPVVPSFMPAAAGSLAELCNRVTIEVNADLGPIGTFDLVVDDPDPMRVLDQQFCVARSHAIDQARSLIAAVDGFTPDEMRTQCEAFAPTMARFTGTLVGRSPAEVGAEVRAFLEGTGAQPAQMSGTARICLGIGYSTDNADLALGSALALAALGETAYGELVGYQVVNGYGVAADCDCGLNWTSAAIGALRSGTQPLVPDPDGERLELLAYAVDTMRAPASAEPTVVNAAPADPAVFALPKTP